MKRLKKYGVPLTVATALAMSMPFLALAQLTGTGSTGGGTAPALPTSPIQSIGTLIGSGGVICNIFRWIFFILIVVAAVFIILAAFQYLTAGGDAEKIKGANRQIVYAAIAVIIAFVARVLPRIAVELIGGTITNTESLC